MGTYIVKRILLFIPTLIAITMVTFLISRLAPGDPAVLRAGIGGEGGQQADRQFTQQMIENIRHQWGLDKPLPEQYYIWAKQVFTLNFGTSLKDDSPVIDKIAERMPITLWMSIGSLILGYLIAIPVGIYSAARPGTVIDKTTSTLLFMFYSLPSFWVATLGIMFLCSVDYLKLFPAAGLHSVQIGPDAPFFERAGDLLWHIVLPIIVMTYGTFAYISRQMRGAMLEVVRQDYIRTARAKGLTEKVVILKHALRNSLIPIITLLTNLLPTLIGGSIVIEQIFSIPGMGKLSFDALLERDYPIIMAVLTISAILTLISVLLADILYSLVDPRIVLNDSSS